MTNPVLRSGARGNSVIELQTFLNERLRPTPNLNPDGNFGRNTRNSVLRYQRENWLVDDGIVGSCTWNALLDIENYKILNRVSLVAQPTASTCWAASTAMILGRRTPVAAPANMLNASGALLNDSELNDAAVSSRFCRNYGLRLYSGQSWTATGLSNIIRRNPVMCNVLWNVQGFSSGAGSDSHWVVFAGIRGSGSANNTTLRVYDPLPQGRGAIFSVNYATLMRNLPAATYQLFQR